MHVLRRFTLSRRTMLRGLVGGSTVALGLPLLEAMLDANGEALADGSALPRHFLSVLISNGFLLSRFEPQQTGPNWTPSDQLAPLAEWKDYVNVCTGFQYRCLLPQAFGHYEGLCAFSGYSHVAQGQVGAFTPAGPSLDQVIADRIAVDTVTPVKSLQVGVSKAMLLQGPIGTSMSFTGEPGALTALPPVQNPQAVWDTLFGTVPGPDAPVDDRQLRTRILDGVRGQTEQLRPKLGTIDNQRLDAHLQAVSELEQKLTALAPSCELPEMPGLANAEPVGAEMIKAVNQVMADLIAYAFLCDITRVASNLFLGMAAEVAFNEAGVSTTHHSNSHVAQYDYGGVALEEYHKGIVFSMECFADLIRTLHDTIDTTGENLLDSTIVFMSSDCSVGWLHSINRQPVVLVGSGGGHLKRPGVHVQAVPNNAGDPDGQATALMPSDGNISDILLACLQAFDPDADSVGEGQPSSNTPLSEILA
jgi:hypothetical protein